MPATVPHVAPLVWFCLVAGAAIACSSSGSNQLSGTGAATGSGTGGAGGSHAASGPASSSGAAGTTGGGAAGVGSTSSSISTGGSVTIGTGGGGSSGHGGAGGGGVLGACQTDRFAATLLPLDVYVMQDQSGSMSETVSEGGTKWEAVTSALTSFVEGPGISGISVGIQYFGLASAPVACGFTCKTNADCGPPSCGPCAGGFCTGSPPTPGDSCTVSDYTTPDVEIAPLPGVASDLVTSLSKHMPSTNTATGPALQGAVDHAQAWAASHPGHVVVALLSTDGEPDECTPATQAAVAQIAATALAGTPSVKTFAIGTFAAADIPSGPDLLDAIAAAGGTGEAFDIDTTQNVNQSFLAALDQIRGEALACQYQIPSPSMGPSADPSQINVVYTPGGAAAEIVTQVAGAASCPTGTVAWYYDNPTSPTQILLCPATCSEVDADPAGTIEIVLGCQTVTGP